jgi:hypothetical protein
MLVLAALCLGIGLGTHMTLLVVVPATILAWLVQVPRRRVSTIMAGGALAAWLLGVAVYSLLPLWSARMVVPSWGDQRTIAGWWTHVTSAEYRYLVGRVPAAQQLSRLGFVARDVLTQIGPVGVALAIWFGIPYGWRTQRSFFAFTGCVACLSLGFAVSYGGTDSDVYLLPWTWAWCIWAGLGMYSVARLPRIQRWGGMSMLVLSVLASMILNGPRLNLHNTWNERDRMMEHLVALPTHAILLTDDDANTFGAWYVQQALDVRPDVTVIDTRLLTREWYQAQVARVLDVPERELCLTLQTNVDTRTYRLTADDRLVKQTAASAASMRCGSSNRLGARAGSLDVPDHAD